MRQWRINLILLFIFLFAAAIIGRLIFLQIINKDFYRALAKGQQNISKELLPLRGEIFFNDGQTKLAANHSIKFLHISPSQIKDKENTANILSQILNLKEEFILEKLNKENSFDEVLKNQLTDEEAKNVANLKLDGVYISEETKRNYLQGELASQVVGYFGGENVGQYGLEESYEKDLRGEMGILEGEKDSRGRLLFLGLDKYLEPRNGSDLILTIDYNIQFFAEKLLKEAKNDLNIESGSILVLEPNSGKILALANFPGFDPNNYSSYKNLDIFRNSVIQKLFEPGSVFKPITMAGALQEEKVTPTTTYEDTGVLKIGGYTIYNYDNRVWGKQTMTEVLEKSINTGAVFAERQLGDSSFLKYVEDFGFFEKTGVDLKGEIFSANSNLREGKEINFATASFGQGIAITPIQLARAFSAIANGGRLVQPYIVEKIVENGEETSPAPSLIKEGAGQAISSKTASTLTAMLISVVENGFGKRAKIPGYYIAGKTGTAQVPWTSLGIDKPGYSEKTIQTFVGFTPAFSPKFLILVKLDNPETKTAEYSAVPIFHNLAKYIIDYWQIPPDYE